MNSSQSSQVNLLVSSFALSPIYTRNQGSQYNTELVYTSKNASLQRNHHLSYVSFAMKLKLIISSFPVVIFVFAKLILQVSSNQCAQYVANRLPYTRHTKFEIGLIDCTHGRDGSRHKETHTTCTNKVKKCNVDHRGQKGIF